MDWLFKRKREHPGRSSESTVVQPDHPFPQTADPAQRVAKALEPAAQIAVQPSSHSDAGADDAAVFISYRRKNALVVEHIHEKYCSVYKPTSIFLDRADIPPGAAFPEQLRNAVSKAKIVLAIIGSDWISMQNERTFSRRLDEDDDWVRQELVLALSGSAHVIPILIDGAKMPLPEQLPVPLRALVERNAVTLSIERFGEDVRSLVANLGSILGEQRVAGLRLGAEGPYAPAAEIKPYALSEEQLDSVIRQLPQWRLVESDIHDDPRVPTGYRRVELIRDFMFESFRDAVAFMGRCSGPIDDFGHHPRWQNVFRTVTVAYSTWDIGHRPSDRDLKSAHMLEKIYKDFMIEIAARR